MYLKFQGLKMENFVPTPKMDNPTFAGTPIKYHCIAILLMKRWK